MSRNTLDQTLLDYPKVPFAEYLNLESNDRLILSGSYGIGKTTFINHFFSKEAQKVCFGNTKFILIYLSPVNYSVASNEDIFRYIKFDILYELIVTQNLILTEEEVTSLNIPLYFLNNIHKILAPLLQLVPDSGEGLLGIHSALLTFFEAFPRLKAKNTNGEPDKNIKNFLNEVLEQEGSLYEENIVTQLIIKLLNKLRTGQENNEGTINQNEIILVLDDLDRIDPHHIFRIFNVFSAHLDSRFERPNKFGLDKIMLVCDIENIKNIFHSQYGTNTDFTGYIDKFYSRHILFFDNKEAIERSLEAILRKLNYQTSKVEYIRHFNSNQILREGLKTLLFDLVRYNKINLRSLFRFLDTKMVLNPNGVKVSENKILYNWQAPGILIIEVLNKFYGDYHHLDHVLYSLPKAFLKSNPPALYLNLLHHALLVLGSPEHLLYNNTEYIVTLEELNLTIISYCNYDQQQFTYSPDQIKFLDKSSRVEVDVRPSLAFIYGKVFEFLKGRSYLR